MDNTPISRRVSSRHYLGMLERAAGVGFWTFDRTNMGLYWSDGMHRLMRTDGASYVPNVDDLLDMALPEDRWILKGAIISATMLENAPVRMRLPDGAFRWQLWSRESFAPGAADQILTGVVQDVTELQNTRSLLIQRQRAYEVMTTLHGGITWRADPGGSLTFDTGWCEFTGTTLVQNQGDRWTERLHPYDRPSAGAAWATAQQNRTIYDTRYRLRRHDGVYQLVDVKGAPMFDASGELIEWIGFCSLVETSTATDAASPSEPVSLLPRELRAARALLDWSIEDLAAASGISASTITRYERAPDEIASMRRSNLAAVTRTLAARGVTVRTISDRRSLSFW